MVPVLYGENSGKIGVAPVLPGMAVLKDRAIEVSGQPDALRDEVGAFFARTGRVREIRVQLCADLEAMPVEDAPVIWPEDRGPHVTVARIAVPAQSSWSEARSRVGDDELAFSPWHGIAAHRPLGGIMRSRRDAYPELSGLRSRINGRPPHEPKAAVTLPD